MPKEQFYSTQTTLYFDDLSKSRACPERAIVRSINFRFRGKAILIKEKPEAVAFACLK